MLGYLVSIVQHRHIDDQYHGKVPFNTNPVWRIRRLNQYADSRLAGIEVDAVQIGKSSAGLVRRSSKKTLSNSSKPTPTQELVIPTKA